jgi:hypothetical protein
MWIGIKMQKGERCVEFRYLDYKIRRELTHSI